MLSSIFERLELLLPNGFKPGVRYWPEEGLVVKRELEGENIALYLELIERRGSNTKVFSEGLLAPVMVEVVPGGKYIFTAYPRCKGSLMDPNILSLVHMGGWKKDIEGDVLLGLKNLHSMGWAHRDVDASNIFMSDEGTFALGDFHLAVRVGRGCCPTHEEKMLLALLDSPTLDSNNWRAY